MTKCKTCEGRGFGCFIGYRDCYFCTHVIKYEKCEYYVKCPKCMEEKEVHKRVFRIPSFDEIYIVMRYVRAINQIDKCEFSPSEYKNEVQKLKDEFDGWRTEE